MHVAIRLVRPPLDAGEEALDSRAIAEHLVVGIAFVALAIFVSDLVGGLVGRYQYGRLIEYSIAIGAWVALWRPVEIFLYDWWPIRAEARLYDRLSAMQVDVVDGTHTRSVA